jgi:hypothetical protein
MEIVYHLGVHLTDEDRIARTLLRNAPLLGAEGISVPYPRHYRHVFRDLLLRLDGQRASAEQQSLLLDAVVPMDEPRRVIFCNENFAGLRQEAIAQGRFYPVLHRRAAALRNLVPDKPVAFCLAVRNPATLLPALFEASQATDFETFLAGTSPTRLSWTEVLVRLRDAVPECPITLWCNEDLPVLWPEVLRAVAGHAAETRLEGVTEFWRQLMSPEGFGRMESYFSDHPPASDLRRRRAVAAFLERFGRREQIEVEIALPGWEADFVEAMTAAYEAEIGEISRLSGVTVLGAGEG